MNPPTCSRSGGATPGTSRSGDVLRAVDLLAEALVALREGREERLVVELTLLRLARPEISTDVASLSARLDRLEQRVRWLGESGAAAAAEASPAPMAAAPRPAPQPAPQREAKPAPEPEPKPAVVPAEAAAQPEPEAAPIAETPAATPAAEPAEAAEFDLATVDGIWPALMSRVRDEAGPRRHALFQVCRPADVEGSLLVFEVPGGHDFHLQQLRNDARLTEIITGVAGELLGGLVRIEFRPGNGSMEPLPMADPEPQRAPDKNALQDSEDGAIDPTSVILEELGGSVVEE